MTSVVPDDGSPLADPRGEHRRLVEQNRYLRDVLRERDKTVEELTASLVHKNAELFMLKHEVENRRIQETFGNIPSASSAGGGPGSSAPLQPIEDMDLDELQQTLRELRAKEASLRGRMALVEGKIQQLGGAWNTPVDWAQAVIHPSEVRSVGSNRSPVEGVNDGDGGRTTPVLSGAVGPPVNGAPSADLWPQFVQWMRSHGITTVEAMKEFLGKHLNKRWLQMDDEVSPRGDASVPPRNLDETTHTKDNRKRAWGHPWKDPDPRSVSPATRRSLQFDLEAESSVRSSRKPPSGDASERSTVSSSTLAASTTLTGAPPSIGGEFDSSNTNRDGGESPRDGTSHPWRYVPPPYDASGSGQSPPEAPRMTGQEAVGARPGSTKSPSRSTSRPRSSSSGGLFRATPLTNSRALLPASRPFARSPSPRSSEGTPPSGRRKWSARCTSPTSPTTHLLSSTFARPDRGDPPRRTALGAPAGTMSTGFPLPNSPPTSTAATPPPPATVRDLGGVVGGRPPPPPRGASPESASTGGGTSTSGSDSLQRRRPRTVIDYSKRATSVASSASGTSGAQQMVIYANGGRGGGARRNTTSQSPRSASATAAPKRVPSVVIPNLRVQTVAGTALAGRSLSPGLQRSVGGTYGAPRRPGPADTSYQAIVASSKLAEEKRKKRNRSAPPRRAAVTSRPAGTPPAVAQSSLTRYLSPSKTRIHV